MTPAVMPHFLQSPPKRTVDEAKRSARWLSADGLGSLLKLTMADGELVGTKVPPRLI
jgi:hypothetical protein